MAYAVYHCEKGSVSPGGIGNHIDRVKGCEHSYQQADPSKLGLNVHFKLNEYSEIPLNKAIEKRINDGYKGNKAIRKDAVKYTTHILTGSHDKMKELEKNPSKFNEWIKANKAFLDQEFGEKNIVRFVLHMDEKTPHIHAVSVNLTSDGRLSAKELIGNRKDMQKRQDRYAEYMKPFGLERGERNTGIKHEDAKAYYARMEKANDIANKDEINVSKNLLGVYKSESVNELKESFKTLKSALISKEYEIRTQNKRIKETTERNQALKQGKDIMQSNYTKLIADEDLYLKERNKAIEQIKKELIYEVGRKVEYKFKLKFESFEQRAEYAMEKIKEIVNEKNISVSLVNEAMKDKETAIKILDKIEKREQNQNRSQSRGFSR